MQKNKPELHAAIREQLAIHDFFEVWMNCDLNKKTGEKMCI